MRTLYTHFTFKYFNAIIFGVLSIECRAEYKRFVELFTRISVLYNRAMNPIVLARLLGINVTALFDSTLAAGNYVARYARGE